MTHYDTALCPGETLTVSGPARVHVSFADGFKIEVDTNVQSQVFGPYERIAKIDVWPVLTKVYKS